MERSFCHPRGMHLQRGAGPWFTGADIPRENNWAGRPFPRWSQDCHNPRWGQGPPNSQWGHPNPQWNHLNPWSGQEHQEPQHFPAPQWDQYHPEPSRDYGFDNGNFPHRGRGSYRRRSRGRFYGKRSGRFFKGKDSSCSSSPVLVKMQQSKKENDSELKKDESAIPKEIKQTQEDSVASVKNTDPPQVSQEASKAIISPSEFSFCLPSDSTHPVCSPAKTEDTKLISQTDSKAIISASQFSFRLPPDSLTSPLCIPAKTEDTELIKLGVGSKTEDSHQGACCTQASTSELPATQENLELKKEDKKIELDELKGTQATDTQPSLAAFLPSSKAPVKGQTPSKAAGSFHLVLKEEPMPDTEVHSYQAASLASDEAPTGKQVPSKVTESVHPTVKEEPMPVPETKQDMNIAISTDPSSVTELSAPSCVIEPPVPLETMEALPSLGKEEDELMESSEPTDHFNHIDSPPTAEIPFISDTTDECQSEGKEGLELTQTGGSHEDTECSQACDAVAGGSSVLPVIPSDVRSVPVIVSGKETAQPYFWESESSLHAQNFNWSDVGKGWAPEDYQEPSWGVDKAKNGGDVSEPEINVVISHSSFHSHYSADPDTGTVLECWSSSSSRSHRNSDSKHSSAQRTIKCLRSLLRQGRHSRSPLRRRGHLRFPMKRDRSSSWDSSGSSGEREITRTDYCCKCHCKCQNPAQERFQERGLPHTYSTPKAHHCHSSKETSKSPRRSHSYSPENSMMKSQNRKKKPMHREETKKGRSASVKETKPSKVEVKPKDGERKSSKVEVKPKEGETKSPKVEVKPKEGETKSSKVEVKPKDGERKSSKWKSQTRKKKPTQHEETKKRRSTSVRQTKPSKTEVKPTEGSSAWWKETMNGGKVLAPINHDAALAAETSIPAETTEHPQSANTDVYETAPLAPSSEDTGFPHQPCAGKETGTSTPSKIVEDPRSVAVLTRRNQIEQDYLQVVLNFAVVATMLLQKEPCMEQALEVALRANMRSVGDYYESMLKNFIDNYDLSETP